MERSREAQSFEIATHPLHTTAPPTLVEWALRSGPGLLGSAEPQPRVPPDLFLLLQRLPLAGTHLYSGSSLSCLCFFLFFFFFILQVLSFIPVSAGVRALFPAYARHPLSGGAGCRKSNPQSEMSKFCDGN